MKSVYFVRHAESTQNVQNKKCIPVFDWTSAGPSLSAYGITMAIEAGTTIASTAHPTLLRELANAAVLCSNLQRTALTLSSMQLGGLQISHRRRIHTELDEVSAWTYWNNHEVVGRRIYQLIVTQPEPIILICGHGWSLACFTKFMNISIPSICLEKNLWMSRNLVMGNNVTLRTQLKQFDIPTLQTVYNPTINKSATTIKFIDTIDINKKLRQKDHTIHTTHPSRTVDDPLLTEYIISHTLLHTRLIQMVHHAKKTIYILSFDLNVCFITETGQSLLTELIQALRRGVYIHIKTSNLNIRIPNGHEYTALHTLKRHFPSQLHLDIEAYRSGDLNYLQPFGMKAINRCLQFLSMVPGCDRKYWTALSQKPPNGIHMRFVCVDQTFLFGGGNYSLKYSDHRDNDTIRWWESGLYFSEVTPRFVQGIVQAFMTCQSPILRQSTKFLLSNTDQYTKVLTLINNANEYLYIENQYFFSGPCGQNRVADAIISRIQKAWSLYQKFRVVLVTNSDFRDDGAGLRYTLLRKLQAHCLTTLLRRVESIVGTRNTTQYLQIFVPRKNSRICIHNKLYAIDSRHVLSTSSNIIDACFHEQGHGEMGWCSLDDSATHDMVYKNSIIQQQPEILQPFTPSHDVHSNPTSWFLSLFSPWNTSNPLHQFGRILNCAILGYMPIHEPLQTYIDNWALRLLGGSHQMHPASLDPTNRHIR